jgi:hypothetical protein
MKPAGLCEKFDGLIYSIVKATHPGMSADDR